MPFKPTYYRETQRTLDTSTNVWHSFLQPIESHDFLSDASTRELRALLLGIPDIRQLLRGVGIEKLGKLGQHVADDAGYGSFVQVIVTDENGRLLERRIETGEVIPENRMNMIRFDTPASGSFLMNAGALAALLVSDPDACKESFMAALRAQQDLWDRQNA